MKFTIQSRILEASALILVVASALFFSAQEASAATYTYNDDLSGAYSDNCNQPIVQFPGGSSSYYICPETFSSPITTTIYRVDTYTYNHNPNGTAYSLYVYDGATNLWNLGSFHAVSDNQITSTLNDNTYTLKTFHFSDGFTMVAGTKYNFFLGNDSVTDIDSRVAIGEGTGSTPFTNCSFPADDLSPCSGGGGFGLTSYPYFKMYDDLIPDESLEYPYVPLSPLTDDILPNNFGFVGKINNQGGAFSMKLKVWGVTDTGYEEEKTFNIPQIANPYFITYSQVWDFLPEGDYEYSWRFCNEAGACTPYWYEVTSTDRIPFSIEENATTPFPVLGGGIETCGDYDYFCNFRNFLNDTLIRIQGMFTQLQIFLVGLWEVDYLSKFFPLNVLLELNDIFTQTISGSEHLSLDLDTGLFGDVSVLSTSTAETWLGSIAIAKLKQLIGYSLYIGLFWFMYETLHKVFIRLTHSRHE